MNGNRKSTTTNAATPTASDRLLDGDLHQLLSAAPADFRALLQFGIQTGLRPRELTELRKDDCIIDGVGQPHVQVRPHKTARSDRPPGSRTVPLCPDAHDILKRQMEAHPDSLLVFLDARGAPYTQYSFKNRLVRLCKQAGLSKTYNPSCLRRTFAGILMDAGAEVTTLSRIMGHMTTRTMERYVSNTPTRNRHRKGVSGL